MAVDAGLTVGGVAAASLLWKVIRHLLELALEEAEDAAVDSAKARLGQAIKKLFGLKGEEEKAFVRAFGKARQEFLQLPGPRGEKMEWLELLLDGKSRDSEEFAEAAVQTHLFERPQAKGRLPWLYRRVVTFTGAEMPAWEVFEPVSVEFFGLLREKLRPSNYYYRSVFDSLAAERTAAAAAAMAGAVAEGELGPALRVIPTPPELSEGKAIAVRKRYCHQLAERCQRLQFLGILTRGEEQPIPLDKIFVDLQVERSVTGMPLWSEGGMPIRIYEMAIEELDLSMHTYSILKEGGITTVGEIIERLVRGNKELQVIRNFGRKSLEELKRTLQLKGFIPAEVPKALAYPLPIQEAIKVHQYMVVLGPPGSGKSTLTRYLAVIFACGQAAERLGIAEERLPLLIPLRDYLVERARHSGDGFSFLDYLYCNAEEILCIDLPKGFFEYYLNRGQCVVLFDGLDEVTDLMERLAVRDAVRSFTKAFSENRYLVTSRPAGYEEAPLRDGYHHFRILDFTDKEIEEFVTKWYELRELSERKVKENKESLLAAIENSPGIKRLAVNPLLLTIIALIHRQEAELPNQRVRLYDKCTEVLLYSWERAKGLKWGIGPEEMRRRLEHIAFWMYEQGKVSAERAMIVERQELEREMAHFLRDRLPDPTQAADEAKRFLDLVRERAGLLMELGWGRYSFVHLTFQEYFAAMDVIYHFYDELDLDVVREVVLGHLHEPAWRELSLLSMSKLKPRQATKLVREILKVGSGYEDVLHRDLLFAARCLADDVEVDWELVQKILVRVVEIFCTTDLWPLRSDTLEALNALRGSRYASPTAELLLQIARDKEVEPWVRREAASSLVELWQVDEAEPILFRFAWDKEDKTGWRSVLYMALKEAVGRSTD